jgi:tetratricopeptide (TPR) repeat protein
MKMSNEIIMSIIVGNAVISILYMVIIGVKTRSFHVLFYGMTMLLCPVMGALLYFSSFVLQLFFPAADINYDELSFDKTKLEFAESVNKERELEILPMEEVLTVSADQDRRRAMLNMLKMDMGENLNLIRKAVENDDTETAHYAAAALTNAFNQFNVELNDLQVKYDKDRSNLEANTEFLDSVLRILNSGGLSGTEESKYYFLYINLVTNLEKYHSEAITEEYYAMMVRALYKVGKMQEAEEWAKLCLERQPDREQSYLNVMNMEYLLEKEDEFRECLKKLTGSNVSLSRDGLDIVRFWLAG